MSIQIKIGQKIKDMRQVMGISQETLALKANIDRTYLPRIEHGKCNISIGILEKLAKALNVKLKDLVDFDV